MSDPIQLPEPGVTRDWGPILNAALREVVRRVTGAMGVNDGLMAAVFRNPAADATKELRIAIDSVAAANYARLQRTLECIPGYGYGDSQAKNPSQGADTGTQFLDRLNGRQRFRSFDNRGIAGTTMGEIAANVVGTWIANSRGIVFVCSGIGNTVNQYGGDGQTSAALAFRTIMTVLHSRARFPVSSPTFAFDGSWTAGASGIENATFDVGVNGDAADLIITTATGAGGVLEIRDGNKLITTIRTGGHKAAFPAAYSIRGLGAGNHILRAKLVSGSLGVVGLSIPSATPAQVVWVTVEPARSNVAQRQAYVDACAAVLTDFPDVIRVTPAADWNPAQHISDEDGLHLNDRGNAYMADRIEAVLSTELEFHQGLNRLSRTTAAPAYVSPNPDPIIIITTYAADTFDRPNGALGMTDNGNYAWAVSAGGAVSIVDNAAEWASASASAGTLATIDDGRSTGKFTAEGITGTTVGLYFGGDANGNGYYCFHSGGNGWRIGKRAPSGFTPLVTGGSTGAPATPVTLSVIKAPDGTMTALVDGAPVATVKDTTYNGTVHGLISLTATRRVTAWRHTDQ